MEKTWKDKEKSSFKPSVSRATTLLLLQRKLEKELKSSYDTQGWEEENKVVYDMKTNVNAFFAYARA